MPSYIGKPRPDAFYDSLTDLENVVLPAHQDHVIPYTESTLETKSPGRKLLVCHDYKVSCTQAIACS